MEASEIAANGFNLSIGRYVKGESGIEVDVEAALTSYLESRESLRSAENVLDDKLKAAGFSA